MEVLTAGEAVVTRGPPRAPRAAFGRSHPALPDPRPGTDQQEPGPAPPAGQEKPSASYSQTKGATNGATSGAIRGAVEGELGPLAAKPLERGEEVMGEVERLLEDTADTVHLVGGWKWR